MTYSSAKTKHSNDYLISESIRRTVRNSSQGNDFDPSYGRLYYYVNPKNDKEIEEFFVSNFIYSTDPSTVWIGEMIKEGEGRYQEWQKKVQSLTYIFKEETESLFENKKIDDMFDCSKGHPPILKSHLGGDISLESMVIYDRILGYGKDFDKRLKDPVWESVSRKIKKYSPFLNIDVSRYKKILKEVIIHGS